jgi:hypothetical protein
MADIALAMAPNMIGLIVRGKKSASDSPKLLEQHADCILSDGSPLGFYGTGQDRSGNSVGLRMDGVVYDYPLLRTQRFFYVDFASAVAYGAVSTTLLVTVSIPQAKAFQDCWNTMKTTPESFNIVGDNCSTHASKAFMEAGVLKSGVPGLDTPNNLYRQLVAGLPGKTRSISGYIGFMPRAAGGFDIRCRPYVLLAGAVVTADRSWS